MIMQWFKLIGTVVKHIVEESIKKAWLVFYKPLEKRKKITSAL